MEKKIVPIKNALESMAARLRVSPDSLKTVLKATVCKGIKNRSTGKYDPITDSEFIAYAVVANSYKLNPFTKEIYAYPDTKSGGIIPIVSTDGWNRLMTTNPGYKTHRYEYSEEIVTPKGGKPCPEWIEIHIEKQDGSVVVVREYLDECFRELSYNNPWQTHTKRMLRHKTKIQGAREAFGFGGIYDQDEAERIIEAEVVKGGKPDVKTPEAIKDESPYKVMLNRFEMAKEILGNEGYYTILEDQGYKHANEIKKVDEGKEILAMMSKAADDKAK